MWIRKSPTELDTEKRARRFSPKHILILTPLVICLLAVFDAIGLCGYPVYVCEPTHSLKDILAQLPMHIASGLCFGLVLYLAQFIMGISWADCAAVICNRCFTVGNVKNRGKQCKCGGVFETLDNWKWMGKGNPSQTSDTTSEPTSGKDSEAHQG